MSGEGARGRAHLPPPSAWEGGRGATGRGDRDLSGKGGAPLSRPSLTRGPPSQAEGGGHSRAKPLAIQLLLALALAALLYGAVDNAAHKLARQGIVAGFGFLSRAAGFDISQRLIPYAAATSTYLDAFFVGLLNTLLVSGLAIAFATILGFAVGIARLSSNFLARALAAVYVEGLRNVPLLLQLLVWYVAVRVALPDASRPAGVSGVAFLSQRGLFLPRPDFSGAAWIVPAMTAGAIVATLALARSSRRAIEAGDKPKPVLVPGVALMLGAPALAWIGLALAGHPVAIAWPARGPYDIEGGLPILPEFAALLIGLSTYAAAFIAEIVRAGLNSVARGQGEAAAALGLGRAQALRLVTIPQAMRVIVPPLTSQYLNVTKNSSLAVLIGYPDLVHVVMGTVLNQTNQAVEAVAMTMAVYLTISLLTAFAMDLYSRRMASAES